MYQAVVQLDALRHARSGRGDTCWPPIVFPQAGLGSGREFDPPCSITRLAIRPLTRYPLTARKISTAISTVFFHNRGPWAVDGIHLWVSASGHAWASSVAVLSKQICLALFWPESSSPNRLVRTAKAHVRSRKCRPNRAERALDASSHRDLSTPRVLSRLRVSRSYGGFHIQAPPFMHIDHDYPQRPMYLCNPCPAVIHKRIHRRFPHLVRRVQSSGKQQPPPTRLCVAPVFSHCTRTMPSRRPLTVSRETVRER